MTKHTLHTLFSAIAVLFVTALWGFPWTEEHQEVLIHQAKEILDTQHKTFSSFEHPVTCDRCVLDLFPDHQAIIFTYGSLLDKNSAANTLSKEAMNTFTLAVAFGALRVFDRDVPLSTRWGPAKKNDTGMLNLWKSSDLNKIVNGAIIKVGKKDLLNLIKREEGYDLVPVPVVLWTEALDSTMQNPHIFMAYTFSASRDHRNQSVFAKPCINPVSGYAHMVKEAAHSYGTPFFHLWMATTFLSDGITPFSEWKENQQVPCP